MTRKDIKIQNPNILMQPFPNIPNEDDNHSVDYTYNAKQENFDAANYNVPNVSVYSQVLFPKYEEDRYGNLSLFTTSIFKPHESICATYLWTEKIPTTSWKVRHMIWKGNNMWLKQGKFPINLQAKSQGEHLLRNANFHVYCDHSALIHILKA